MAIRTRFVEAVVPSLSSSQRIAGLRSAAVARAIGLRSPVLAYKKNRTLPVCRMASSTLDTGGSRQIADPLPANAAEGDAGEFGKRSSSGSRLRDPHLAGGTQTTFALLAPLPPTNDLPRRKNLAFARPISARSTRVSVHPGTATESGGEVRGNSAGGYVTILPDAMQHRAAISLDLSASLWDK